ncbi:MAG: EAL domain-containing protein [Planctomycetaceae bacterium]
MRRPRHKPTSAVLDFSHFDAFESGSDASENAVWSLVRRSETGEDEHRTEISAGCLTVGRRPNNRLCICQRTVSGHHAELTVSGDELVLKDLGSTNGTLVNGRRVTGSVVLQDGDVVHFGQVVFSIARSVLRPSSSGNFGNKTFVAAAPEDAVLYEGFDRLLNQPDIDPHFQPIVRLGSGDIVGYEVLVRSHVKGLEFPDRIFRIAAMRTSEAKLSEVCRTEGLLSAIQLDPHACYFLNTHAAELETPRLLSSLRELRSDFPAMRIVLEVHEAAITSVQYLIDLSRTLADLDIQLAYDDFGAGQARLIELFEVPPTYLKFDLKIVRGLENASPLHRASVRALVNMVHDLNVIALAEGVETQAQADICTELGFEMAQGYLFGRPQPREFWQRTMVEAPTLEIPVVEYDDEELVPGEFS